MTDLVIRSDITNPPVAEFLAWVRDRLVYVYGEQENMDYVQALGRIVTSLHPDNQPNLARRIYREFEGETHLWVEDYDWCEICNHEGHVCHFDGDPVPHDHPYHTSCAEDFEASKKPEHPSGEIRKWET